MALIHSVDSLHLLEEIEHESAKLSQKTEILLQVKIAVEETKYGLNEDELKEIIELVNAGKFTHIVTRGSWVWLRLQRQRSRLKRICQLKDHFNKTKEMLETSSWFRYLVDGYVWRFWSSGGRRFKHGSCWKSYLWRKIIFLEEIKPNYRFVVKTLFDTTLFTIIIAKSCKDDHFSKVYQGKTKHAAATMAAPLGLEKYTGPWTDAHSAHLLRRTVFGGRFQDIKNLPVRAWILQFPSLPIWSL